MLSTTYKTQIAEAASDPMKSYCEAEKALKNLSSLTKTFKRFLHKIITNDTSEMNKDLETITEYLSKTQNLGSIIKEDPEILNVAQNRDYYFAGKLFDMNVYSKYALPILTNKTILKRNIQKYGGFLLKAYVSKIVEDKQ
ncbi:hypothetical protein COV13_02245 [Candidatus Woesearchaeota archaeon CG10_big_fil_rev_8_21_14_0_10_32_9]|nr:MAG: hypothetical protein COV13_02245 [Candidatus Woesearchaeota archaeon CG10_big_fil_rev_8_21_14_0_10_32_9]